MMIGKEWNVQSMDECDFKNIILEEGERECIGYEYYVK
jgi:hypothetical protein